MFGLTMDSGSLLVIEDFDRRGRDWVTAENLEWQRLRARKYTFCQKTTTNALTSTSTRYTNVFLDFAFALYLALRRSQTRQEDREFTTFSSCN